MKGNEGGAILGWLERFIFFAAFLSQAYVIIAGWLAFKVASKWNVWSNIISIPSELKDIDEIDYLVARRHWGSHLLMTFQIGVAYNIIAALLGATIAHHWDKILDALRAL